MGQIQNSEQNRVTGQRQYYSPGGQIYYWYGESFGLTGIQEAGRDILLYMGAEDVVKAALSTGKRSKHPAKNKILDRELSAAREYYARQREANQ